MFEIYYDVNYNIIHIGMTNRLELLNHHVKKETKIADSSFDFLNLGSLCTPEENVFIISSRKSAERLGTLPKHK